MRLRAPEAATNLQVDEALLGQLVPGAPPDLRFPQPAGQLHRPAAAAGVTRGEATDAAALQVEALALLDQVLDGFVEAREREGGKLAAAISERVDGIERIATEVRTLIPAIRDGQRASWPHAWPTCRTRSTPAAPSRSWCCGCKLDVDEELDRLGSTSSRSAACSSSASRSPPGLLQEFNRETNTLGSSRWTAARPMPRWAEGADRPDPRAGAEHRMMLHPAAGARAPLSFQRISAR